MITSVLPPLYGSQCIFFISVRYGVQNAFSIASLFNASIVNEI